MAGAAVVAKVGRGVSIERSAAAAASARWQSTHASGARVRTRGHADRRDIPGRGWRRARPTAEMRWRGGRRPGTSFAPGALFVAALATQTELTAVPILMAARARVGQANAVVAPVAGAARDTLVCAGEGESGPRVIELGVGPAHFAVAPAARGGSGWAEATPAGGDAEGKGARGAPAWRGEAVGAGVGAACRGAPDEGRAPDINAAARQAAAAAPPLRGHDPTPPIKARAPRSSLCESRRDSPDNPSGARDSAWPSGPAPPRPAHGNAGTSTRRACRATRSR